MDVFVYILSMKILIFFLEFCRGIASIRIGKLNAICAFQFQTKLLDIMKITYLDRGVHIEVSYSTIR